MAYRNGEARRGCNLDRASKMSLGGDVFEDTAPLRQHQEQKLIRRLGVSVEVAALIIELAGIGSQEARR